MASAHDVAAFIVHWFGQKPKAENDLTQLKLQKLLYYCQGHYLAWAGEPLFSEDIQAWDHGPVVPAVYLAYRNTNGQGAKVVTECVGGDVNAIDNRTKSFIREVLNVRGQYSAWRLRELTHAESPWKESFEKARKSKISTESMKEFFEQYIR